MLRVDIIIQDRVERGVKDSLESPERISLSIMCSAQRSVEEAL
jgi:hypothetical protein